MRTFLSWLIPPVVSAVLLWADAQRDRRRVKLALVFPGVLLTTFASHTVGVDPSAHTAAIWPISIALLPALAAAVDVRYTHLDVGFDLRVKPIVLMRWLSATGCYWVAQLGVVELIQAFRVGRSM